MKNKRGLSDVVTTVLMILLTLLAIGILWVVIQNVIQGGVDDISKSTACITLGQKIKAVSCKTTAAGVGNITVSLDADAGEIKSLKAVYTAADGTAKTQEYSNPPKELETSRYDFSGLGLAPKSVSIAAGIADSKGKIGYCSPSAAIECA